MLRAPGRFRWGFGGSGFPGFSGILGFGELRGQKAGVVPPGGGVRPLCSLQVQISTSSNNSGTSACQPNFSVMRLRMVSLATTSP